MGLITACVHVGRCGVHLTALVETANRRDFSRQQGLKRSFRPAGRESGQQTSTKPETGGGGVSVTNETPVLAIFSRGICCVKSVRCENLWRGALECFKVRPSEPSNSKYPAHGRTSASACATRNYLYLLLCQPTTTKTALSAYLKSLRLASDSDSQRWNEVLSLSRSSTLGWVLERRSCFPSRLAKSCAEQQL